MTDDVVSDLVARLRTLGLRHTADQLSDLIALATRKRLGPTQILERIVAGEEAERAQRSLERRTTRSRVGRFKPMADFDWNWPSKIPRDAVDAALALDFVADARNVVLVAPQGLGKTMIAPPASARRLPTPRRFA
jgi:DNA replication protein DnaC